jgi:hypothetical protein
MKEISFTLKFQIIPTYFNFMHIMYTYDTTRTISLFEDNFNKLQQIINNKSLALLNLHHKYDFFKLISQEIISGNKIIIMDIKET